MWALPFFFLGLFFYYPLAQVVDRAMFQDGTLSFLNLSKVLGSQHLLSVMWFTLKQAALSAALSMVLGMALAHLLSNYSFRGRNLMRSLTIIPFALPPITVALGFVLLYGENGFLMSSMKTLLGLEDAPFQVLYSLQGIVLAHAFYNAPIVARFVSAAWERIPQRLGESAKTFGASRLRSFVDIELPLLLPSLLSGTLLAFIFSFISFPIVLALGGAHFATIEVEIYLKALGGAIDYSEAAALALVTLAISSIIVMIFLQFERSNRITGFRADRDMTAPLKSRVSVLLLSIFLGFFFLGPIVAIFIDSLTIQVGGETALSLQWFESVLSPTYSASVAATPLSSILNSLAFAAAATSIAFGFGLLLSISLSRWRSRILEMLSMAPIAISPVVLGLSFLWFYSRPPLAIRGTWVAIVIVHAIVALPFVIRAVRPALSQLDWRLVDAARSLGASSSQSLIGIVLPMLRSSLMAGVVFAFAVSMAEMSATIMLIGPELVTMPLSVYFLFGSRQFGAASAMSVVLILVLGVSLLLMDRFARGSSTRGGIRWLS